jgi:hypothetical protein
MVPRERGRFFIVLWHRGEQLNDDVHPGNQVIEARLEIEWNGYHLSVKLVANSIYLISSLDCISCRPFRGSNEAHNGTWWPQLQKIEFSYY